MVKSKYFFNLNHVLPFHCYSIWDFISRVRQSRGEIKKGTGVPCSFNLQASQMDLRWPNEGYKKGGGYSPWPRPYIANRKCMQPCSWKNNSSWLCGQWCRQASKVRVGLRETSSYCSLQHKLTPCLLHALMKIVALISVLCYWNV